MSSTKLPGRILSTLRQFLDNGASGGIVLMVVAAIAIIAANSPIAESYFDLLHLYVGPLNLQHWINDALMAVFFLLVGLEIKREMLDGQLSSWSRRMLPGAAAAGGRVFPALTYVWLNWENPGAIRGWAIPTATDIAFALGGAFLVLANLLLFNRMRVMSLWPYLVLGAVLWVLVFASGVHATLAGVMLALTIPLKLTPGKPEATHDDSPLHRLEHGLHKPVAFLVVPIFGFANAGVSLAGVSTEILSEPLTMGVAAGLLVGKLVGVLGTVFVLVKLKFANLPAHASWGQMAGVAFLCGIGFTMSLFIGLLAFNDPSVQDYVKIGILFGSAVSGLLGALCLSVFSRRGTTS